jgi:catechol 2,3-dioxygenase-like lactoylglutathione lyase family enzyme
MVETVRPVDPGVDIGHVHLEVADLERSLAFYCGVLGFQLTQRYGPGAAFVSAGGYHHHLGLNTWESRGGAPRRPLRAAPGSTTSPSGTRRLPRSAMRCVAWSRRGSRSTARATMA